MIKATKQIIFRWILSFFSVLMLMMVSCGTEPVRAPSTNHFRVMDDSVITYNKGIVTTEDRQIGDFISRYKWNMKTSPTGLRYLIYKTSNGKQAVKGQMVTINYTARLLNGDLAYSSMEEGPKTFQVGHSDVERGLDEGILLLRVGERAKFILPSHLAFGVLGDQNRIPQNATLVYDVELIKIK
jgi:FKBP-type peptidyl-prolyl cis-trans isomerase FkpA